MKNFVPATIPYLNALSISEENAEEKNFTEFLTANMHLHIIETITITTTTKTVK